MEKINLHTSPELAKQQADELLSQDPESVMAKSFIKVRKDADKKSKEEPVLPVNFFMYVNKKGDEIVSIDKVADYIIARYKIKTVSGIKSETLNLFTGQIYNPTGKAIIKSRIEDLLGSYARNNIVNEILEKIKRKTGCSIEEFDKKPNNMVCVKNGILDFSDLNDIKILPHDEKYNFTDMFPIIYDPLATCPKCIKFVDDTFYPDDVPQVQRWLGFHIQRNYLFKKAVIIHGPQDTGKSVFLNLLDRFVGSNNISGLSLQKISMGKGFDLLALKGKYANIHDDLSSKDLCDGGGFKMSVGDGIICGEEKFGDHYKFRNSAKMTFACNQIPSVKDINDPAYYGRWLVWRLDTQVTPEEKNPYLIDDLTIEEELSGLLNWAIEGYKLLIQDNNFSNEKTPEQIKALMVREGNPLAKFAADVLVKQDGSKISKEILYQVYCSYCENSTPQLSPCTKTQLGKQLPRFAPYVMASKSGSERYWLNINIHPNCDTWDTFQKIMSNI